MKDFDERQRLQIGATSLALEKIPGKTPGIMWLGGYRSDMFGMKASALADWARETGQAFLRHDYSGHGLSGGNFEDGTISLWLSESLTIFHSLTKGPQILVGSSMGAWIALLMALTLNSQKNRNNAVRGLVLIAPAPDFTKDLVEPLLDESQRRQLLEEGRIELSSRGNHPVSYTRRLLEDGSKNLILTGPIRTRCPVHILHGMADELVPFNHALKLSACLPTEDLVFSCVSDGDHRLSRPQDILMLLSAVGKMIARVHP